MPGRERRCRFRHAVPLCILATVALSCGSVGDPLPPLVNLPQPIRDLSAQQVGDRISVSWSWPLTTTEGAIARQVGGFTVWAVDVPGFETELDPETIDVYRREVLTLGSSKLADLGPGDQVETSIPLAEWRLGQETLLVVTASNQADRDAGYSNQVELQPLEPPGATDWAEVAVQPHGIELAWLPAQHTDEYVIERSEGDDGEFSPLGRLAATSFIDRTARWGETYQYRLRPLRLSKAGWIEGPLSAGTSVTPLDTFPPAPPEGLRAVRTASSVELSWLPSPEDDVAGYRVLRAGQAISPLVRGTTYSDPFEGVSPAEFSVSAVDVNGNESQPGSPITVPPTIRR